MAIHFFISSSSNNFLNITPLIKFWFKYFLYNFPQTLGPFFASSTDYLALKVRHVSSKIASISLEL